jgi:arsenate reductase-like glutaredoxin family protein
MLEKDHSSQSVSPIHNLLNQLDAAIKRLNRDKDSTLRDPLARKISETSQPLRDPPPSPLLH